MLMLFLEVDDYKGKEVLQELKIGSPFSLVTIVKWIKWEPPPGGMLKMNVDGASKGRSVLSGGGVIAIAKGSEFAAYSKIEEDWDSEVWGLFTMNWIVRNFRFSFGLNSAEFLTCCELLLSASLADWCCELVCDSGAGAFRRRTRFRALVCLGSLSWEIAIAKGSEFAAYSKIEEDWDSEVWGLFTMNWIVRNFRFSFGLNSAEFLTCCELLVLRTEGWLLLFFWFWSFLLVWQIGAVSWSVTQEQELSGGGPGSEPWCA
ncbi:unnamed protein product [Ilex paraguariensis]|uniref:RNase H type-1 domain-containing protein n=1 Tax=Ilex paraguariensis TaxID=185542 RepID=A0ABC8RZY8_9AQUA